MTKRIFLAGLLGGIAMYVWSSIAHIVTPLSTIGFSQMSNEQPVLDALHAALGSANGLYSYPGMDTSGRVSMSAAMEQYEKKLATNPSGILIYHPPGMKAMETSQLVTEFVAELVEALVAVFLLSLTRLTGFGARVGFVTLVGALASIATNISYWNWYGFPTAYTATYMGLEIVGYFFVGVVAALIMRRI